MITSSFTSRQWSLTFGLIQKADKEINHYSAVWLESRLNWGWEGTWKGDSEKASQGK